ncbi:MAG: hypothetical protein JNL97_10210 [Verrucomicrobiales bacterium]|nr:hypothetical protein [Verrucomicrobiales bacterium]
MSQKPSRPRRRSGNALWRELQPHVERLLRTKLKASLKHADVGEVVGLALAQLEHRDLGAAAEEAGEAPSRAEASTRGDWLERVAGILARGVEAEAFVDECERTAEYRSSGTSSDRRTEIVRGFLEEQRRRIRDWVEAMLEDRGRSLAGDAAVDEVAGKVMDVLFSQAAFDKLTSAHRPGKGMTFRRFLEKKAFWMCQDAVAKYVEGQPYVVSLEGLLGVADPRLEPDVLPGGGGGWDADAETGGEGLPGWEAGEGGPPGESGEEGGVDREGSARGFSLRDLLEWVDAQDIGERPKALVYLYYKAYVEPEIVPEFVVRMSIGGIARLREDYADTQQALETLRMEFRAAATDLAAKESQSTARFEALRRRFRPDPREWADLEAMAGRSTLTELEEEMLAADPAREEKWVCELEYMMALRRLDLARRAYEKARLEMAPYLGVRKPWVRSQKELSDVLGAPVGTMGRELAEIRRVLRDYPLGGGASRDFGAPE